MITALIPARAGSERVQDKNIRDLMGKPLLFYSIATALHCPSIDRVYISTNSEEYKKIAEEAGATVIMRPESLCGPGVADYPVIEHFLKNGPKDPEYVVYLRPTTPLRSIYVVESAIKTIRDLPGIPEGPTSLRSVEEMGESAYKCYWMIGPYLMPIGSLTLEETGMPNQGFIRTFKPNGYVDIVRPEIIEEGITWGQNIYGYVTPPIIEIDTEHDFRLIEYTLAVGKEGEYVVYK